MPDAWGYLKDGSAAPIDEEIYARVKKRLESAEGEDFRQIWREYQHEYERGHGKVLYERPPHPPVEEQGERYAPAIKEHEKEEKEMRKYGEQRVRDYEREQRKETREYEEFYGPLIREHEKEERKKKRKQ